MAGTAADIAGGCQKLENLIDNKSGIKKFREFIATQGGDPSITKQRSLLPQACHSLIIDSPVEGYISKINAERIGYFSILLGAGREFKGQEIDLAAGMFMQIRVGDFVKESSPLAVIYANAADKLAKVKELFLSAIVF